MLGYVIIPMTSHLVPLTKPHPALPPPSHHFTLRLIIPTKLRTASLFLIATRKTIPLVVWPLSQRPASQPSLTCFSLLSSL